MNSIKDIARETLRIYRENFSRLLAIVAIVQVSFVILLYALSPPFNVTQGKIESINLHFPMLTVSLVYFFVAFPLMIGALIHTVSEIYLQKRIDIARSYRFAWERLGALIGGLSLPILAFMGIFVGSILIITKGIGGAVVPGVMSFIPIIIFFAGVYFLPRFLFIFQVIVLEGLGPIAALSRSSALVKGNWWRVFGNFSVVGIMTGLITSILAIIPVVGITIGTILAIPIFAIESTLLYYDLRRRKEEYSVDSLRGELKIGVSHDKGQYDQAISDFTKALWINPKDDIAYYNRGIAYGKKGQHDQAISDFDKALEINPRYAKAYYNRGVAYYSKKEYDKSWEDVNKAQDLGYKIPDKFLENLRKASGRQN